MFALDVISYRDSDSELQFCPTNPQPQLHDVLLSDDADRVPLNSKGIGSLPGS